AASLATLVSNQVLRPSKIRRAMEMAEAFVRAIKRDYVHVSLRPNAECVMRQLPAWIAPYNRVHRVRLSIIVHPVSSLRLTKKTDRVRSFGGDNTPQIQPLSPFCQLHNNFFCVK